MNVHKTTGYRRTPYVVEPRVLNDHGRDQLLLGGVRLPEHQALLREFKDRADGFSRPESANTARSSVDVHMHGDLVPLRLARHYRPDLI